MPDVKIRPAFPALPGALDRPDWQPGAFIRPGDLALEQNYFVQRFRRHLRLVHGWGVVCGLNVVPVPGAHGWNLFVCPGYGISPCGDEIVVPERFEFDLSDFLWLQPVGTLANRIWISIEAEEVASAFESNSQSPCACGGCCSHERKEVSRIRDGLRVVVSWIAPLFTRSVFDICTRATPPCLACPETCVLPLARVLLPSRNVAIPASAIDNTIFRGA